MSTLREAAIGAMGALETARNGLAWYRDRYPESTDGSDDEAAGDIDAAIDALRAELAKPDARPAPAEPQPAAQQEPLCMCKDRALSACPGEWEPGCDLGNNPAHARPAGYTQAGFLSALGRSPKPKGRSQQVADGLPPFLSTVSLKPLITKEIIDTTVPIVFRTATKGDSHE